MTSIFIKSYTDEYESSVLVNLETLIILHVLQFCDKSNNIELKVVTESLTNVQEPLFQVQGSFKVAKETPTIATYGIWPVLVTENLVVAGLASVSRHIIKKCGADKHILALLGFREACLMACNETSIWTKFCEIDIPSTVKDFIHNSSSYIKNDSINLPVHLSRFERHMEQAIRIHNVYKLARIRNNDKLIKSNTPIEQLNLEHKYAEGPFLTVSDILLFPCYKIFYKIFTLQDLSTELPLSTLWYKNVTEALQSMSELNFSFSFESIPKMDTRKIIQEEVAKQSLYTADPKRYKPQNRIYTKQSDIDQAFSVISNTLKVTNDTKTFGYETKFNWDQIPTEINPTGGALPQSRASRKCQQLENLAKAVLAVSKNNPSCTIVDFCSGSGHLGLLIASLLPSSHVILVENKERSLKRAEERVRKLNLTNVSLVQSNLDYFDINFDIGIALHACGVATDLVIKKSIKSKANFVVCPCCYGGIHDCHHVKYPRSKVLRNSQLSYRDYLILGHSADQTHDENNSKTSQGYACMDVIDTDRKLQAEEFGYKVFLSKLSPPSCTPKNNLLVGIVNTY